MSKQRRAQSALLPVSPLLMTESEAEFDRVRDAFDQEIKPRGIIEQMHVADVAYLTWEILRLRRCKAGIINSAFCAALERLLVQALRKPGGFNLDVEDEAGRLAREWFIDPEAKKQVSGLLKNFQLDETAIEAEAIRTSAEDLERLDRLLASLESRSQQGAALHRRLSRRFCAAAARERRPDDRRQSPRAGKTLQQEAIGGRLTMASERQIAANRRNARKSTGPRSSAGKRRTSRNSYRHGFSASVTPDAEHAKRIERLARKIAGNATDVVILKCARDAAQAELDLAQIRRVKVALIERMMAFGEFQARLPFESTREIIRALKSVRAAGYRDCSDSCRGRNDYAFS
jgi:hypothetical protein